MTITKNGVESSRLRELVYAALPMQGSVEIQKDAVWKEHTWHQHPTDETIVVLDGDLNFYAEGVEATCHPGDIISLPAGTRHGSRAGAAGAIYMIAFRTVEFTNG